MPKKILIIEDEQYLLDIYKLKFAKAGYEVLVARDGAEGIALAKSKLPDLILLDIILPKLDGYQVLTELKKDVATSKITVFILSNLMQNEEIKKGLATGADGYFVKANLTPSQLLSKVRQVFSGKLVLAKNKISPQEETAGASSAKVKPAAKILLIEDEEAIINMYTLCFGKAGYKMEVARNGAWGLKLAKEQPFDVIMLDMVMPAMNGYQAIKQLKSGVKTKNIPIIVLSNSAQDQDIAQAKESGAANYFLKSKITPTRLVKEVEKVLQQRVIHSS